MLPFDRDEAREVGGDAENASASSRFPGVADSASPTPSTWPETRWPPSSSPTRSERSRLTACRPASVPSVVLLSVSAEASTANQSAPTSTAVRQQPEQAIEAPIAIAAVSGQGAAIDQPHVRAVAEGRDGADGAECGDDAGEHSGRSLLNSVSMSSPRGVSAMRVEARHGVKLLDAERLHRGPAVAAHHRGRMEPGDAIHQIGAQQRRGELGAALHQHPGQPGVAQRCQRRRGIDPGLGAGDLDQRDAEIGEGVPAVAIGALADQDPGRRLARRWRPASRSAACADGCRRRRAPPGVARKPGMRQVSSGLSASTVPTPTITASCRPRSAWAARRAASPVIQWLSPDARGDPAIQRRGQLQRHQRPALADARAEPGDQFVGLVLQHALLDRDAGRAQPGDAGAVHARVRVAGGDHHAGDAGGDQRIGAGRRAAPVAARLQRDIDGAPRAAVPAMSSAAGSACGRPPGAVTARPTTRPSLTTTQPTEGLGQVLPSPRRASASAARIWATSSACRGVTARP